MLLTKLRKWLVAKKRKRKDTSRDSIRQNYSSSSEMSTLGKPLERLPIMFVKDCGYIPVVLTNAASVIEKNIKAKELFQTQGTASRVNSSLSQLNAPRTARFKTANVHDVVEAMKLFLVRLPEPLLSDDICEALITASQKESVDSCINVLSEFRKSSPYNFAIVHFMMKLLKKVSQFADYNCMDVRKLATVFVLDVIKPLKLEDSNDGMFLSERMQRLPYLIMVIENLINNVSIFKSVGQLKAEEISLQGSPSAGCLLRPHSFTTAHGSKSVSGSIDPHMPRKNSPRPLHNHESYGVQVDNLQDEYQSSKPLVQGAFLNVLSDSFEATGVDGDKKDAVPSANKSLPCEGEVEMPCSAGALKTEKTAEHVFSIDRKIHVDQKEGGIQAVKPSRYTHKTKKMTSPGPGHLKTKKFIHAVDSGFRPSSPKRKRAASKSKGESGQTMQITPFRSAEKKFLPHPKISHHNSTHNKRKRKVKSISKKSKSEHSRASCCESRNSDFSAFHPDEEITPWNETATNSDDNSLMNKTIRNPRILAVVPSNKKSHGNIKNPETRGPIDFLVKTNPQPIIMDYGFRTISQMDRQSPLVCNDFSSSSSESLIPQAAVKGMKKPPRKEVVCPSQSIQSFNSEIMPAICKELIKGVKMKDGVGVNTSPDPVKNRTNLNIKPRNRIPQHGICKGSILNEPSLGTVFPPNINKGALIGSSTLVKAPLPSMNLTRPSTKHEFEQTLKRLGEGNNPARHELQCECCPLTLNTSPQQRVTVTLKHGHPCNAHNNHLQPIQQAELHYQELTLPRSSIGEWLVDIFLVCITLFCTCFVFYIHQQSSAQDGFLPD